MKEKLQEIAILITGLIVGWAIGQIISMLLGI